MAGAVWLMKSDGQTALATGTFSGQGVEGPIAGNVGQSNPVQIGVAANSAAGGPSAGTTTRTIVAQADLAGRLVTKPNGTPASHAPLTPAALTATTETTILAAGGATIRHELATLLIANRDNIAHTVDVRDTLAGTIRITAIVPAGTTQVLSFDSLYSAAALNAAWTVQLREGATTAVEFTGQAFKTTA